MSVLIKFIQNFVICIIPFERRLLDEGEPMSRHYYFRTQFSAVYFPKTNTQNTKIEPPDFPSVNTSQNCCEMMLTFFLHGQVLVVEISDTQLFLDGDCGFFTIRQITVKNRALGQIFLTRIVRPRNTI